MAGDDVGQSIASAALFHPESHRLVGDRLLMLPDVREVQFGHDGSHTLNSIFERQGPCRRRRDKGNLAAPQGKQVAGELFGRLTIVRSGPQPPANAVVDRSLFQLTSAFRSADYQSQVVIPQRNFDGAPQLGAEGLAEIRQQKADQRLARPPSLCWMRAPDSWMAPM